MADKETGLASVKVIPFSGKDEEWREWSKKVLAFATVKGWQKALFSTSSQDKEVTDQMMVSALNFLTMSLTDQAFAFVENAPNAAQVWDELNEEFEPCEDTDVYELQEEFTRCKLLHTRENPTLWFKRLEHLNQRLRKIDPKYKKNDDDVKIHVRVNLPEGLYSELITKTRDELKTMSVKDFKKQIKSHWRRFTRNDEEQEKTEQAERVLKTTDSNKDRTGRKFTKTRQLKGICRRCGHPLLCMRKTWT